MTAGQAAMFDTALVAVSEVPAVEEAFEPATMNREAWLARAVDVLRPMFAERAGAELPETVAVSVGWPGGKSIRKTIGQCWATRACDGVPQMFISPVLADPVDVLAVLIHELVHAFDDCQHGHKAPFARVARAMGLEGKMTATTPTAALRAELAVVADTIGPYPHKRISLGEGVVKTQTTRMLKVECPVDGYTVRMTRKWLDDLGTPTCPCGERMDEVGA